MIRLYETRFLCDLDVYAMIGTERYLKTLSFKSLKKNIYEVVIAFVSAIVVCFLDQLQAFKTTMHRPGARTLGLQVNLSKVETELK